MRGVNAAMSTDRDARWRTVVRIGVMVHYKGGVRRAKSYGFGFGAVAPIS